MTTEWMIYICGINLLSFAVFGYDKRCAKKDMWRIPEKTLFFLAFAGGSAGAWAGMYVFRHKTRKQRFRTGIPFLMLVQAAAGVLAIFGKN
ncbi:DUF1294 domain-containing protein [Lachnospiraceae bacterium 50-23]